MGSRMARIARYDLKSICIFNALCIADFRLWRIMLRVCSSLDLFVQLTA